MSLYLKYRPQKISELDLQGVRTTLGEMIKSNALSHAYLFTGPRGAGKTSAARILARVINCEKNDTQLAEPCNTCDACRAILGGSAVDVVEIDAASNRGIDDIRELKERIKLAPATLRKKVYIIDEVHMLTTEAFNALLKTLEEPPSHAVFILCTTEAHKVPETINSRCVRVAFTKATPDEMKRSFRRVVDGEKADIADDALDLISRSVDGSFRDGVKTLDTLIGLGRPIVLADAEKALYGSSKNNIAALAAALINKDIATALDIFRTATGEGSDIVYLLTTLMRTLGEKVTRDGKTELIPLIYSLDDTARKISLSPVPQLLAEIAMVEWCGGSANQQVGGSGNRQAGKSVNQLVSELVGQQTGKPTNRSTDQRANRQTGHSDQSIQRNEETQHAIENVANVEGPVGDIDAIDAWNKLIANLSGESYSLGALLSKARPGMIKGNVLTIEMNHSFHKEQLMQEKFRARVEELISRVVGQKMLIDCIVAARTHTVSDQAPLQSASHVDTIAQVDPEENELLQAAEEIFGN